MSASGPHDTLTQRPALRHPTWGTGCTRSPTERPHLPTISLQTGLLPSHRDTPPPPPPSETPGSPGRFPPATPGFTALFTRQPRYWPRGGHPSPSPRLTVLATWTKRRSPEPHSRGAHCGEEATGKGRTPLPPLPSLPSSRHPSGRPPGSLPGAHSVPRPPAAPLFGPSRLPAAQHGPRATGVPPHAAQVEGGCRQQQRQEQKQQLRRHLPPSTEPSRCRGGAGAWSRLPPRAPAPRPELRE